MGSIDFMMLTLAQVASLFTVPWLASAGALAILIPLAIHLLSRLRRKREPWGAMRFLTQAYRKHKRRLQLEQWLLLLVRCLLVLVLGLALAGPVIRGMSYFGRADLGRSVYLVIDNSLSSQAVDAQGISRLESLKATARAIVEVLTPTDQVIFYPQTSGETAVLRHPTQALAAIDAMKPSYTSSELVATLKAVNRRIKQDRVPAGQAVVILLSDWSRAMSDLTQPMRESLANLGQSAQVLAIPPAVSRDNVQVQILMLRRNMIAAEDQTSAALPVQVQLRRFGGLSDVTVTGLEVTVFDVDGLALATATRRLQWSAGQTVVGVNLDLLVTFEQPADGRTLILKARLQNQDTLAGDNQRFAIAHVRHHLRVGLVDDVMSDQGLQGRRWLELALQPMGPGQGVFGSSQGMVHLLPTEMIAEKLAQLDAVMLLRPDLLSQASWQVLGDFVTQGGLLWVLTPSQEQTALWTRDMVKALKVPWSVGMDFQQVPDDALAWKLDLETSVPEALQVLSADWKDLLGPIRVMRRLPMTTPASSAWLSVETDEPGATLLAATRVGKGAVLLLGAALDTQGSNLMTKPLFVPLLHETLRSLLGDKPGQAHEQQVGLSASLNSDWDQVALLQPMMIPDFLKREDVPDVALHEPFNFPGVYGPSSSSSLRLAVNIDADAGDTQTVDRARLADWLDGLGLWAYLDQKNLASSLAPVTDETALDWALLWLALALVLLETWLARVMSFAHASERRSWTQRIANTVRHLRHDEPIPPSRKGLIP